MHGIAPAGLRGGRVLGHTAQCATVLGLSVFRCAMLAFIRDPFMTSHASSGPVPVDLLGLNNGLVQPSFRAQCTGPPRTVPHISVFGMLFAVLYSPSFATCS